MKVLKTAAIKNIKPKIVLTPIVSTCLYTIAANCKLAILFIKLKTLDTNGNCQRPVFHLVYLNIQYAQNNKLVEIGY